MPSLADSLVTLLAFTLDAQMLAPSKTTATGFPTRKKDVVVFAGYQRKMATWLGSYFNWRAPVLLERSRPLLSLLQLRIASCTFLLFQAALCFTAYLL